jgi:thiol-disulfide isomerase/thioredoxin
MIAGGGGHRAGYEVLPDGRRPVINSAPLLLLGLAVGIAEARGDEPSNTGASGRVVEGKVIAAEGKPVEGAMVLFCQADRGMAFIEGATALTDSHGRYRADLSRFPWSTGPIRALVLAPGYKAGDRNIGVGPRTATADFDVVAEPWKETRIRMEDSSGRPVVGQEITCSVGEVIWARPKTDALGGCRIAMAHGMLLRLSAQPKDARPIQAVLDVTRDGPPSITLPVLPPIRGRVLDPEGRPVPDAAVGRWLTFGDDGVGEMLRFPDGAVAVTDRDGKFVIAPRLNLRFYKSQPMPKLEALCFAAPSFRSESYQLFNPNRPIRIAHRTYDPSRPVEPMTVTLQPSRRVRIPISRGFVTSRRKIQIESQISIAPRQDLPDWRFILINRAAKPTGGSPAEADTTVLEEYLPEGTYPIEVALLDEASDESLGEARGMIIVPRGEGPLDLPPLAVEPPEYQKLVGKPAPEIDAIDLDTGRPVKLADFRGKVVLLDFWGYWCGVCVTNMPHLVELQSKFAGRPLAILALHDQSVQSRAAYDRKIAAVRQRLWGGRDLPFRVLLDRPDPSKPKDLDAEGTGMTIGRYHITGFPTLFVIDRDGTLIGTADHSNPARLESLIRGLLEKPESIR